MTQRTQPGREAAGLFRPDSPGIAARYRNDNCTLVRQCTRMPNLPDILPEII